jgi:hypothetical protein
MKKIGTVSAAKLAFFGQPDTEFLQLLTLLPHVAISISSFEEISSWKRMFLCRSQT